MPFNNLNEGQLPKVTKALLERSVNIFFENGKMRNPGRFKLVSRDKSFYFQMRQNVGICTCYKRQ